MFKKVILYQLKVLVVAGVGLFVFNSCDGKEPGESPIPLHDTSLTFHQDNMNDVLYPFDKITKHTDSTSVRYVYLVPTGDWTNISEEGISIIVELLFKPATEVSPKVKGNGKDGFDFKPGAVSAADSTWLSNNGWPVNQN